MTANHCANIFAGLLPLEVTLVLYGLGGVTFPIMAFLLVEGFHYTSNLRAYALRLGIFAVVAQVPYSLLWRTTPNVLFTLLVGLLVLWVQRRNFFSGAGLLAVVLACLLTAPFDWGGIGPVMIYLMALDRPSKRGILGALAVAYVVVLLPALSFLLQTGGDGASLITGEMGVGSFNTIEVLGWHWAMVGQVLYAGIGFSLAALLLWHYNGQRGRSMKWFFYAYYPGHLLVLWALAVLALGW